MKIKNYRTSYILAGIVILGLCTACSKQKIKEVNETPTISERSLVNSEVFENGFGYPSLSLDFFVLIKGENWRYEEKLNHVEFYQEADDKSHVMNITSMDAEGQKEHVWRENWFNNMQKLSGYEYIGQNNLLIGENEYDGWEYTFKGKVLESTAIVKDYLWKAGDRFYMLSVVTKESFSDEYIKTISTLLDSFMTYEEFEKAQRGEEK